MRTLKSIVSFANVIAVVFLGVLITACARHHSGLEASFSPEEITTLPSRVAITIDDLPFVPRSRTSIEDGLTHVEDINAALAKHNIIATGFAVGKQIDAETIPAIQAFTDAGHAIGNHSWSHPDYGNLSIEQFRDETARAHQILKPWITGPRYYRFPFLREGKTEQARVAAKLVLDELGYRNVPVSIDNDEWEFNADYLQAIKQGNKPKAAQIARQYLTHMKERTLHFQNLARNELGSDVDHILLIHMNRINADHLRALLDWYAEQGWTFITLEEALKNSVYSQQNRYTGPRGLSQIERVLGKASN